MHRELLCNQTKEEVTPTGLEGISANADCIMDYESRLSEVGAESGATAAKIDSNLAFVVRAWSGLRDDARVCILDIVRRDITADDVG